MKQQYSDLMYFIDNIEIKNSLGYFIKITVTTCKGSFSFFVGSLKEIPSKYIHYNVTGIDIIKPTKKEFKTLKNFYQNVKDILCILEIKIESEED